MAHLPLTILVRESFIQDELKASSETKLKILNECTSQISKAMDLLVNALNNKKKILLWLLIFYAVRGKELYFFSILKINLSNLFVIIVTIFLTQRSFIFFEIFITSDTSDPLGFTAAFHYLLCWYSIAMVC